MAWKNAYGTCEQFIIGYVLGYPRSYYFLFARFSSLLVSNNFV